MTAPFTTLSEFSALCHDLPATDATAHAGAVARNAQLTKPAGALGRLEDLAIWYAGWRGTDRPAVNNPQVVVFAGNHGVAASGVSAFPAEVTEQMVLNFQHGGAAINQLCTAFGATLNVHALDLDRPTADFSTAPAMDDAEVLAALTAGWTAVDSNADLLVTGEMGIGNTTSAAAILAALHGGDAADWAGRGTGVDDTGLQRKVDCINTALSLHGGLLDDPIQVLRCVGGRELAAMAGAILRARVDRIPVLLDGFICTAAASVLHAIHPAALDHVQAAHVSAEGAHAAALDKLGQVPLLALGLRLGEASGAALAIGVLKGAIACHSGMATFAEAGVSDA